MQTSQPAPFSALERRSTSHANELGQDYNAVRDAVEQLERAFAHVFSIVDVEDGIVRAPARGSLQCDLEPRMPILAAVAERNKSEIVEHESPLALLAVPLGGFAGGRSLVAVGIFADMRVNTDAEASSAASVFGLDPPRIRQWTSTAEVWSPRVLVRLADATIANVQEAIQARYLEREINEAVAHARDTYAELGLLHRLARKLNVSQDDGDLWQRAVEWLAEAVPAQCLAVAPARTCPELSQWLDRPALRAAHHGEMPFEMADLLKMVESLGSAAHRPLVLNRSQTASPTWLFAEVRELALAPIKVQSEVSGWLVAINHPGRGSGDLGEFGSAELRLLESAATLLAIHRSNIGLFLRQADLFGSSVRALISAIDAKDQYTHGHSERVARVASCLAEELGLSQEDVGTAYLGGLLHDIGKIGVDDRVLNKCGPLTPEEFAQIKQHPRLGYEILHGVKQLEKILPIVLHHHEAWDGSGYPYGLRGEETPLLARVTAVADAYDAMASDRPYRPGMPAEKLEAILREGAGRQWDPAVVDAFFAGQDRIKAALSNAQFPAAPLDPLQWVN